MATKSRMSSRPRWLLNPTGWVALAMVAVLALMFVPDEGPKAIGKALDEKIALIREQLAEARDAAQRGRGAQGRI